MVEVSDLEPERHPQRDQRQQWNHPLSDHRWVEQPEQQHEQAAGGECHERRKCGPVDRRAVNAGQDPHRAAVVIGEEAIAGGGSTSDRVALTVG